MAFSRFSSFRRGSVRRFSGKARFGSRRVLRDPQRTKHLECSTIFIDEESSISNTSAALIQVYTHIASLPISLGNTSNSPEGRVGRVLASSWRYIQIHGIVLDWGIELPRGWDGTSATNGGIWTRFELVTDRLDVNTTDVATPASAGSYNPFSNIWPIASLSTTAPNDAAQQVTLPTRIHWGKTDFQDLRAGRVDDTNEGELYVPNGQKVRFRNPTINRRLRIRIDDDHGFFLTWHIQNSADFNISAPLALSARRWANGKIYYRMMA